MKPKKLAATSKVNTFDAYLEEMQSNPEFMETFADEQQLQKLTNELITLRKKLRINQTEVASRMGVRQPTVSGFENDNADPRISTLQRYARAINARIVISVETSPHISANCNAWVLAYRHESPRRMDSLPTACTDNVVDSTPASSNYALAV